MDMGNIVRCVDVPNACHRQSVNNRNAGVVDGGIMPEISLKDAADVAQILMAACAFFALAGVGLEYLAQKRRSRLEHAQRVVEGFDRDELIVFAVTCLDWAAGMIPVPTAWQQAMADRPAEPDEDSQNGFDRMEQKAIGSLIRPDPKAIYIALRLQLNDKTNASPVLLLYRHAFVRLLNHFERIEDLRALGVIGVADLRSIAWIAEQLTHWRYGSPDIFAAAIDGWYPGGKVRGLLNRLLSMTTK